MPLDSVGNIDLMGKVAPPSASVDQRRPLGWVVHHLTLVQCAQVAESILRARATRNAIFGDSLFSDPAWDLLLELFIAHARQVRLTVGMLGLSSGVSQTTTLRWLAVFVERGLIERVDDPFDGRRVFASLSETGALSMVQLLQGIQPLAA
jgi:DNA-binding MarR family transcriptional regulator